MKLYRELDPTKELRQSGDIPLPDGMWIRPISKEEVTQEQKEEQLVKEAIGSIHELAESIRVLASSIKNK